MGSYRETIRDNLRKYRKLAGMSQRDLAARLGVTSAAISNWEKGVNSIDIDTLFELCDILKVSVSDIGESLAREEDLLLSPQEEELVKAFRRCTRERKDIILELVGLKRDARTSQESNKDAI